MRQLGNYGRFKGSLLISASMAMILSGCATNAPPGSPYGPGKTSTGFFDTSNPCSNGNATIGAIVGAGLGLGLGLALHQKPGTVIGATLGGAGAGALIGHVLDERRCSLYRIAQANNLRIASAQITNEKLGLGQQKDNIGLDVQVMNRGDEFAPGTAVLLPQSKQYLTQMAQQYVPAPVQAAPNAVPQNVPSLADRKVLIVAHTSEADGGASEANLSAQRAKAVADVFAAQGVPAKNIYYQGAGSSLPVADNATPSGQAENRRIQIVDLPNTQDMGQYLQTRSSNPAYFSVAKPTNAAPAASSNQTTPASNPPSLAETPIVKPPSSSVASEKASKHSPYNGYDFGGMPAVPQEAAIDIGVPISHSMFNILPQAYAASPVQIGSCLQDTPRVATEVRNLATGDELAPRNYIPGFDNAVWTADANGNFVAIIGAAVPIDTGAPIPTPKLLIYKHYTGNPHQKPSFKAATPVNVYIGSSKMLYRIFANGPAQCIDLIVPTHRFNSDGKLYYQRDAIEYIASPVFSKK